MRKIEPRAIGPPKGSAPWIFPSNPSRGRWLKVVPEKVCTVWNPLPSELQRKSALEEYPYRSPFVVASRPKGGFSAGFVPAVTSWSDVNIEPSRDRRNRSGTVLAPLRVVAP